MVLGSDFGFIEASVEDHHPARDLAGPHGGEALVDLLDLVYAADELVELEPAVEVEVDEAREVARRPHGAVHGALERLLLERHEIGRDGGSDGHWRPGEHAAARARAG